MNQLLIYRMHESPEAPTGLQRLQSINVLLCALLACATMLVAGCGGDSAAKPVSITPNDVCFYCKSPINDVAFAAEFITKTGFVRKFDDIGCLVANARKVGKKNILAFYAMDAQSKTFFPADQVQYVRSDKLRTPRNGGIVAIQDPVQAKNLAARYQGELVKFDDLVK